MNLNPSMDETSLFPIGEGTDANHQSNGVISDEFVQETLDRRSGKLNKKSTKKSIRDGHMNTHEPGQTCCKCTIF